MHFAHLHDFNKTNESENAYLCKKIYDQCVGLCKFVQIFIVQIVSNMYHAVHLAGYFSTNTTIKQLTMLKYFIGMYAGVWCTRRTPITNS